MFWQDLPIRLGQAHPRPTALQDDLRAVIDAQDLPPSVVSWNLSSGARWHWRLLPKARRFNRTLRALAWLGAARSVRVDEPRLWRGSRFWRGGKGPWLKAQSRARAALVQGLSRGMALSSTMHLEGGRSPNSCSGQSIIPQ